MEGDIYNYSNSLSHAVCKGHGSGFASAIAFSESDQVEPTIPPFKLHLEKLTVSSS
jgi:hypothetical protein